MARTYLLIWVALLLLLGVSILLGAAGNTGLATSLIFLIAIFKAILVAAFYMGLRWEPRYLVVMLFFGILLMVILYLALLPDIVHVYGN